jgi:hypothetical protein
MEWWRTGEMEDWSGGVVEWWSGGVVECWSINSRPKSELKNQDSLRVFSE